MTRTARLYAVAAPVVIRYRYLEQAQKLFPRPDEETANAEWHALDVAHADHIVDMLKDLRGMYTKYGQMAAGLTANVSEHWSERLRDLEDAVPPRPVDDVLRTIEEETNKPWTETFEAFDEKPLGSASIGQVHRATLRANRKQVCVKVQYPDAQNLFAQDMKTIRSFCRIFAPEQVIIFDELTRQLKEEFDYRQEAANLNQVSANLRATRYLPRDVDVPKPLEKLCTRRMLVMELLPGPKLVDGMRVCAEEEARRLGLSLPDYEAEMRRRFDEDGVPSSYRGASATTIALYTSALRAGVAVRNVAALTYDWTVAKPLGLRQAGWVSARPPPNVPRIVDTLMRVHGHQLLVDGTFQSDPHAGNFLLMPDGRVGLIDYGATKRLTRAERLSACLLYAALWRGDQSRVLQLCKVGGYKSRHMDEGVAYKLCRFGFDTYGRDLLGGKNIQQFMDDLHKTDPLEEAADNLVMASLLSVRLRAVGLSMGYPIVCSRWWGPMADRVLRDEGLPYEVWDETLMQEHLTADIRVAKGAV